MVNSQPSLLEIVGPLWSRKVWVLIPTILGLGAAVIGIATAPPMYYASVLVQVQPPAVPANYVKTTVTSRLQDQLRTLEERIERRESIVTVIEELGLFADLRDDLTMDELVELAREYLSIEVERGSLVRIGVNGSDPREVADAANRFAELFIRENLTLRESQAEKTTAFVEAELERTRRQLEEEEERLAQFRLENTGSLPEQQSVNLAVISQLETRLEQNQANQEDAQLRRLLLQQGSDSGREEVIPKASPRSTRIDDLRLQLGQLLSQYTEVHPDVIRLRAEINSLENERPVPPIEQETLGDIPDEIPATTLQLSALEQKIGALELERQEIVREMVFYQRRLEKTPRVEQGLKSLTRDYQSLQKSYQSLLGKRIEARLAEELERTQHSQQFMIVEEATTPRKPYHPNRLLFLSVGLVLGGGLGAGLALIRDRLDATFKNEDDLARAYPGIPAVIAIPHLAQEEDRGSASGRSREEKSA